MSWETRKGHGMYYTRSQRVGGRIVREYIGCGELALLVAERDEAERQRRQAEATRRRELQARYEALDAEVGEVCQLADAVAEAVLLAERAEDSLLDAIAQEQLAFREAMKRKLELLRAELGGPHPTPSERLLVERVIACWLQVQHADALCAQAKGRSWKENDYMQRQQDRAHRRFLSAIKTLATVRKLALPALQLNIGRNQVHVAGGTDG